MLPTIGYRNIKTGIAVFLSIVIYSLLDRTDYFYVCVATILCMGNTIESSINAGKHRIIGTLIGGLFSVLLIWLVNFTSIKYTNPILLGIGISTVIHLCNMFKAQEACSLGCVVFLSIMINYTNENAISYVFLRTFDTLMGVFIAFLINTTIKPYDTKNNEG
ncbi:FUSC family protein [Paraclostridium dentum]|uniref:FUSC family protein n=1 Tax=Paraclostridium dentum TaxID=2662455 RepID=UPI003B007B8D